MSIIYSYPTSQPTVDDLLIGTDVNDDNATKSFSVQSLVSLINAAQGTGIITDVTISNVDVFLEAIKTSQPGAPAVTYTIGLTNLPTVGLETTQFYRGDGQWAVPTVTSGIIVSQNNVQRTNDVAKFNFTGNGVTVSSSGNDVSIDIPESPGLISSIDSGVGISLNQNVGDIIIANTGIVSISQGPGITALTANGVTTISALNTSTGTVTSVQPGLGLQLQNGSTSVNPTIGIDYLGTGNFVNAGKSSATILTTDTLLFEQQSSGDIKSATWGEIQATIPATPGGGTNNIKNDTDIPPYSTSVPRVDNVITLTTTEYGAITSFAGKGNTLYLVTGAAAPPITDYVKRHDITANVSAPSGVTYLIESFVPDGTTITGAANSTSDVTTSITIQTAGYRFASGSPSIVPNPNVVSFVNNDPFATTVTATIEAVPVGQCTSTLGISIGSGLTSSGAEEFRDFNITTNVALAQTSTSGCGQALTPSTLWNVTLTLVTGAAGSGIGTDKFRIDPSNTISYNYNPSGTVTYAQSNPECAIGGNIIVKQFTVDYAITDTVNTNGSLRDTQYTLTTTSTGLPFNSTGVTFPTQTVNYGTSYEINTIAAPKTGFNFTSGPTLTQTGDPTSGIVTSNVSVALTVSGDTAAANGTVHLGGFTQSITLGSGSTIADYNAGWSYRIEDPQGNIIQNWQYSNIDGVPGNPPAPTYYEPTVPAPVGSIVKHRFESEAEPGYFYSSGPFLSYGGVTYGPPLNSPGFVISGAQATLVAGNTNLLASTLTGTINENRTSISVSSKYNCAMCDQPNGNQACRADRQNNAYLQKGTNNTLNFAEPGDIAYSSPTGSGFLAGTNASPGFYASPIENGVIGYIEVRDNGYIYTADPCENG